MLEKPRSYTHQIIREILRKTYSDTHRTACRDDEELGDARMQGINQDQRRNGEGGGKQSWGWGGRKKTKSLESFSPRRKRSKTVRQKMTEKEGNLCFQAGLPTLRGYYIRAPIRKVHTRSNKDKDEKIQR